MRALAGLVLLLAFVHGPAQADSLRAEQITPKNAAQRIIGGPDAIGGVGDWYLANDVVEIIVDDPARTHGKLNHGGTIIDAGLIKRRNEDQFARLFPMLNLDQRVFLNYDRIRAEVNETQGWARLVVSSQNGVSSLPRGSWLRRKLDLLVPEPEALRDVYVETEYRVQRGEPFVYLTTTIRNEGAHAAPVFAYGDVLMRGRRGLRAFTGNTLDPKASPGFHHRSFDRSSLIRAGDVMAPLTFVTTPGSRGYPPISYSFFAPETTSEGRVPFFGVTDDQVSMMAIFLFEHDWKRLSPWRIFRASRKRLPAGASWIYRRRLLITGTSDVASATDVIFPLLGYANGQRGFRGIIKPGRVPHMLHVADALTGAPVTAIATRTSGRKAGHFQAVLPPATYVLSIRAAQRPLDKRQIEVPESGFADALDYRSAEPAYLAFDRRFAEDGPARVIVTGEEGTPDPIFSPELFDFRIDGERVPSATETNSLFFVGHANDPRRVAIRPGKYRITVMRGLEFDVASEVVEVSGAGLGTYVRRLRASRAVTLPEYLRADFHVHGQASDDTNLSNELRLRMYLAQGMNVFIATDHDHVPSYGAALVSLGMQERIRVIPGAEITSSAPSPLAPWTIGHTNAWPLRRARLAHRRAAPPSQNLTLPDLYALLRRDFGVEVVQMNHPRNEGVGESGYLERLGPKGRSYDPMRPLTEPPNQSLLTPGADGHTRAIDFDTLELMNGPSLARFQRVRKDLHSFLKQGYRRTGTAVSDGHGPEQPALPCSYVHFPPGLSGFDAHAFNSAVRAGRLFGTTGPLFTRFRVNEGRMGDLVKAPGGRVRIEFSVAAAPWVPVQEVRLLVNGELERIFRDLPALESARAVRLEQQLELVLERDSFVTLEAGAPLPSQPGTPNDPPGGVYSDVIAPGFVPMAFTNAIYVDVDGNGTFDPPGL